MGLKGLMTVLGMNGFAIGALLVSFTTFVAILAWACTRPQREIDLQARLCIDDDDAPATPSSPASEDLGHG
ncbi:MAG: hypothetical protein ACYC6Y_03330 [Thermoguttaceae bacterium]